MQKIYYLSSFRSKFIGAIFLFMGIGTSFIGFHPEVGIWGNFQNMVLDFSSFLDFFASLLILFFKLGFLILGYIFLKFNDKIERAKLDEKGFYFKPLTGTNKWDRISFDLNDFEFVSYKNIEDIFLKRNSFRGEFLELKTKKGKVDLLSLDALKSSEKKEIFETIKNKIKF